MGLYENIPYVNFHELNLEWILQEVKNAIAEWEAMKVEWSDTKQAWEDLKTYVNDYFANLDVQEEINIKLDQMAQDGSLDAIVEPYLADYFTEIMTKVNNQDNRIAVLEGRMDRFSSLTEGSTTGDAELQDIRVGYNGYSWPTAGDAVRGQVAELESGFKQAQQYNAGAKRLIDGHVPYIIAFENGNIQNGADTNASYKKRLRNLGYVATDAVDYLVMKAKIPMKLYVVYFDSGYQQAETVDTGATTVEKVVTIKKEHAYFRLVMIAYTDGTYNTQINITPLDANENVEAWSYFRPKAGSLVYNNVACERYSGAPIYEIPVLENGNIRNGADSTASYNQRVRTKGYWQTDNFNKVVVKDGSYIRIYVMYFTDTDPEGYVKAEPFDQVAFISALYPYFRLTFIKYPDVAHSSQLNITPQNIYNDIVFMHHSELPTAENQVIQDTLEGVREQLGEANRRIDALEILNGTGSMPVYYEAYMATKVNEINTRADAYTNGDQFIFATDYHGLEYAGKYHNTNNMHSLINYIVNNTSISLTVNGGDVANSYQGRRGRAEFLRAVRRICQYFMPDSYATTLFVAGNHDLGCDGQGGGVSPAVISEQDLYVNSGLASIASKLSISSETMWNYYYDNINSKTRYIVLLTSNLASWGFDNTQYAYSFLAESLQTMETDWSAVVFIHWPFGTTDITTQASELATIMSTYNARGVYGEFDFAGCQGHAPCIIGGHQHRDESAVVTPVSGHPIVIVMTTTACVDGEVTSSTNVREPGTVTEEAFDVFTLDMDARKLYATRIGGGQDRNWSF